MPKLPAAPPDEDTGRSDRAEQQRATAVCRAVLAALGRPADFLRMTARPVTGDCYRVNVVTGADASQPRIAHSYFVTADEDGRVIGSSPAIARHY